MVIEAFPIELSERVFVNFDHLIIGDENLATFVEVFFTKERITNNLFPV